MKRHAVWGMMGVMVLASAVFAQPAAPPAPAQDGQNAQQGDTGGGRGDRRNRQGRQGRQGGQRGGGMFGMELPASLNLTEEQNNKIREIYRNSFTEMRQQRTQDPQAMQQTMQRAQELRRQMDEAAQAGDDTKVQQLQAEMDNSAMGQSRKQMQDRINRDIEQVLTPEQRVKFDRWRRLRDSGLPSQLIDNPENLKNAALKIKTLSDIQKNTIEAAYERYDRSAGHADAATKESLQDIFANDVLNALKPSQKHLLTASAMQERMGRMRGNRGGANGAAPGGAPGAANGAAGGNASGGTAPGGAPVGGAPAPAGQ